ncbi:hypothetical protein QWY29_20985, partial [Nocardioides sp. SOB72]|nr:hypothetical protein [Nocardioides abyssi]
YGVFGDAQVVHVADSAGQLSAHAHLAASGAGDQTSALDGIHAGLERAARKPDWSAWVSTRQDPGPAGG